MLERLGVRNFKAWRDSGEIRLAPLTVLFGANSAGKTSIPHLLLMLRQTVESADRRQVLDLGTGTRSSLVELGSFTDILFQHDLERALEFELAWRAREPVLVSDPLSGLELSSSALSFDCSIAAGPEGQPRVERFAFHVRGGGSEVAAGMRRQGADRGRGREAEYELVLDGHPAMPQPGRGGALPPPYRFHGFPAEAVAYYQGTASLPGLSLALDDELGSIYHVGPLRESPERIHVWSGERREHVGARGERAVEAILAARDRRFGWRRGDVAGDVAGGGGGGGEERPLEALVAERLHDMGLIDTFRIRPVAEGRREHEVLLRTSPGLPEVRLTDVGFGVSQVLPVMVECFSTPPGSIVIFEQPEIHLHPRVQAELADVFVDALHATEGGVERGTQFIIESHSEHFLRRLQRRMAEERLTPEDAALYFVHTDAAEARLEPLDVDAYGNILNWPEGFFGDEMGELLARADAQARRMRGGRDGPGTRA